MFAGLCRELWRGGDDFLLKLSNLLFFTNPTTLLRDKKSATKRSVKNGTAKCMKAILTELL